MFELQWFHYRFLYVSYVAKTFEYDDLTARVFAVIDLCFSCIFRQVCLFLKRGATQNDGDEDGQDPLSIAVQQANADIVTLYVSLYTFHNVFYLFSSFNYFF